MGANEKKGWKRYITKPWNYRTQKETLVHELVHYRFPSIQHGKRFEQRIKEILRGKTFEPKHTHYSQTIRSVGQKV